MNRKNMLFWGALCAPFVLSLFLFSCASASTRFDGGASLENFEPVPLENVRAQHRTSAGMKALELELYFIPFASLVEIHFTADKISRTFLLDETDRQILPELALSFIAGQSTGEAAVVAEFPSREGLEPLSVYVREENGKRYFVLAGDAEIYFSPAQLELFLAAIDDELLQDITETLRNGEAL